VARRATVTFDLETAQAQAKLEDTQEELQQTEGAAEGTQQAFRSMSASADRSGSDIRSMSVGASSAMTRVAGASEEASSSVRKVGQSASSSATNLGFELVGAAQDAQFGIAGLANQIPLITEQFQRLRQRTGSTTSALSTLGGTFLGPAGIVGAITLGLPLVQELASELFSAGDAADKAGESAAAADKQFQGLFETTDQLASGLPNLQGAAEDVEAQLNDVGDAGVANLGGLIGSGGLLESNFIAELRQIQAGRGARSSVQEIRQAIQGSSEEAQLLQSALENAGIDVERLLTANLEEARQEIEQNIATLARFGRDPVPFLEDPEVAADAIQRQFRDVTNQLQSQVADGLIGEEEALNQRVEFLRKRLKQASAQFGGIAGQQSFERLQTSLQFLEGRLDELEEGQSGAADETERQEQAMNGLAVSAKQAAENMQVVERTFNSMDQMPMQRRINAFGAGRTPTIGGTMLSQGRSQGDLMLEAARDAGFISQFGTLQQTLGSVGQAAQDAGGDVEQNVNRELQRGVNLASQIGTTLIRAARRGGVEFEQVFGTILSAVGGTLSAIPGVGTIAGPILGGAGQLISAFDRGGVVDTPLQVVGESGPELAALPQGTRVSTARETERMLSQQQVNVNVTGEIRRLRSRELGLILREDETRRNQFGYSS
jgi:hypothetical protein